MNKFCLKISKNVILKIFFIPGYENNCWNLSDHMAAARSIRIFAEYLERHPEAILTGKRGDQ